MRKITNLTTISISEICSPYLVLSSTTCTPGIGMCLFCLHEISVPFESEKSKQGVVGTSQHSNVIATYSKARLRIVHYVQSNPYYF